MYQTLFKFNNSDKWKNDLTNEYEIINKPVKYFITYFTNASGGI
jgi:hypothetical protein